MGMGVLPLGEDLIVERQVELDLLEDCIPDRMLTRTSRSTIVLSRG
jgi:hypothetical protein